MGLLENIVAVVFVLGVMIFVHELGHFLAARYFDVRVEAFAFGFGPRLFGFKRGETDYKVCLLPLGGYVKMSGAEHLGEATGDERDLPSKPRWQRLIIAAMGPVFNVILAILLPAGLFMVQYERLAFFLEPATLGYVDEGSPADLAGIREGDTVVEINRRATPTWEAVKLAEIAAANSTIDVTRMKFNESTDAAIRNISPSRVQSYSPRPTRTIGAQIRMLQAISRKAQ
jgi:regulator of sigma E protease